MPPKFLIYLAVAAIVMVFSAPAAEGTLFLTMCLLRSPLCPFFTTTPLCQPNFVWDRNLRLCVAAE
ncbi:uncharacterized protein LOC116805007 [Drosophila grimshawi]|uniref:uncharacterized protein LOC116805007 n=1 Tax=Drosophila grimshawi TaxID=7222 RepID=UPI0013EEEC14|nr:uncharacterized protein LOC116805007 [Drosophila grimshawi]